MPVQTVYKLTPEGEERLEYMITNGLSSQEFIKFEYSIPMAFIERLPPDKAIEQVLKRRDWLKQFVEQIPPEEQDHKVESSLGKRANIRLLRTHYHLEIEWLDWVISELSKKQIVRGMRGDSRPTKNYF